MSKKESFVQASIVWYICKQQEKKNGKYISRDMPCEVQLFPTVCHYVMYRDSGKAYKPHRRLIHPFAAFYLESSNVVALTENTMF